MDRRLFPVIELALGVGFAAVGFLVMAEHRRVGTLLLSMAATVALFAVQRRLSD